MVTTLSICFVKTVRIKFKLFKLFDKQIVGVLLEKIYLNSV